MSVNQKIPGSAPPGLGTFKKELLINVDMVLTGEHST